MTISLTKKKPFRSKAIRDAARGEHCTLRIPFGVCEDDISTTVLAHLPGAYVDGTGKKGGKVSDLAAVFACDRCHAWMDRREFRHVWMRDQDRTMILLRALTETHQRLGERGVIVAVVKNGDT